jgi:glycosyltransferase involved in cell wall biosynthesis
MARRISVAFSNMVNPDWLAGGQYLYNLLFAIKSSEMNIETVLRIFPETPKENYQMLDGLLDRVLEVPHPLPCWVGRLPGVVKRRFSLVQYFEERELRQGGIDAQFLFADSGNTPSIPVATWLPDFQHLHLPELFRAEDLAYRANFYPLAARKSNAVVLSSQHAFDDLKRVAPDTLPKARILNFVAQIPADVYQADSEAVARLYHLPDKFFFLPNQFWRHKNHKIMIQAVKTAKKEIKDITVVCSGGTHDFRSPSYFDALLTEIAVCGLQDNIRILGRVPREHFWQLMRRSLAVLQPSLFEGWNTSVEEVKSLGKSIIVSDIPVHREQNPASALYFDPRNPDELAQCLVKTYKAKMPGPELELEESARSQIRERTRVFAKTFYNIIVELAN